MPSYELRLPEKGTMPGPSDSFNIASACSSISHSPSPKMVRKSTKYKEIADVRMNEQTQILAYTCCRCEAIAVRIEDMGAIMSAGQKDISEQVLSFDNRVDMVLKKMNGQQGSRSAGHSKAMWTVSPHPASPLQDTRSLATSIPVCFPTIDEGITYYLPKKKKIT